MIYGRSAVAAVDRIQPGNLIYGTSERAAAASAGRLLGKLGEVPEKSRSAVRAAYSVGDNRIGKTTGELWRRCRLIHVGVMGGAVPVYGAGGTPALPGGFTPRGQARRNVSAPLPVDPRRGDKRGCAGQWCGRDARAPEGGFIPWDRHTIGTRFGNKVADALWWRLLLCEVDSYSCKFVFIRGSSS